MPTLNPDKLKIGYVILVSTHKLAIEKLQRKADLVISPNGLMLQVASVA